MTERKDDIGLDAFFAAARDDVPLPSGDLMARIQAEALAEMPVAGARAAPGFWAQLRDALGGWKGAAGLAAACACGVWIGISPPEGLSDYWQGAEAGLGALGLDPVSGYDLALFEG
ncbi:hypothetical protein SAMN04488093_11411 [Tropicibacter naphthalenivorans]|uniref:Dihydroorotate dehydrogenase n=2 Tax=Tropicibacter naphthalenivorans TaxID=441103 RepID=A0A0P1GKJ2_9RHOB|nr:hypothetical protein TRN7648_03991 [Tropicibacter naphthalenivorans]SMD06052.1 hypothetical protein SAMN04488093_11411 [Tropicibacter naphthalenivorans]